jgi:hypothetical protein
VLGREGLHYCPQCSAHIPSALTVLGIGARHTQTGFGKPGWSPVLDSVALQYVVHSTMYVVHLVLNWTGLDHSTTTAVAGGCLGPCAKKQYLGGWGLWGAMDALPPPVPRLA